MDREEIQQNLNQVFQDVFEDKSIAVRDDMTASDVKDWDSLNHVTLIVSVEKTFGVRFTTKEVNSLKNVGEMIDLIGKKKNSTGGSSF
ncbi:MAG: acyl carrier protein [Candidatus Omnitrophota bacterium]